MKVTLYRYEKETLVMRSVEMEKLQAALRTENLNKPVSTTRDKAMFALPGTQNSYIQKLPVVVFGGTFRKTGDPAPPMRDYSGLVLLEVNHLSDLQEAAPPYVPPCHGRNTTRSLSNSPDSLLESNP